MAYKGPGSSFVSNPVNAVTGGAVGGVFGGAVGGTADWMSRSKNRYNPARYNQADYLAMLASGGVSLANPVSVAAGGYSRAAQDTAIDATNATAAQAQAQEQFLNMRNMLAQKYLDQRKTQKAAAQKLASFGSTVSPASRLGGTDAAYSTILGG